MARPNLWLVRRIVLFVAGVLVFSQAIHADTNFGPFAGLICGAFSFLFVLVVVMKNSDTTEQIFEPTSPCWPPGQYPQAYWSTSGAVLLLSGVVNLVFHLRDPAAVSLYVGFSLLGLGTFAGAVLAHYQIRRRSL
jgi:uncharacterized membrane protein HdeD (DUF308 family)